MSMMEHFISVQNMSKEDMMSLLIMADKYREGEYQLAKQALGAHLYVEPGTSKKKSFIVAETTLGMETLKFNTENSSRKKGESLYDTAKTFEAIGADVLVIRHASDEWANDLQKHISIPLINAGAGTK